MSWLVWDYVQTNKLLPSLSEKSGLKVFIEKVWLWFCFCLQQLFSREGRVRFVLKQIKSFCWKHLCMEQNPWNIYDSFSSLQIFCTQKTSARQITNTDSRILKKRTKSFLKIIFLWHRSYTSGRNASWAKLVMGETGGYRCFSAHAEEIVIRGKKYSTWWIFVPRVTSDKKL